MPLFYLLLSYHKVWRVFNRISLHGNFCLINSFYPLEENLEIMHTTSLQILCLVINP